MNIVSDKKWDKMMEDEYRNRASREPLIRTSPDECCDTERPSDTSTPDLVRGMRDSYKQRGYDNGDD